MRQRSTPALQLALVLAIAMTVAAPASAQFAPLCPIDENGRVADVFYEGTVVFFEPIVEHERLQLSVSTPCGTIVKDFEKGQTPFFDIREVVGEVDGAYSWELRVVPVVDPSVRKELAEARESGDLMTPIELQNKGLLPSGPLVDSAGFTVFRGEIIDPASGEEESGAKSTFVGAGLSPSRANGDGVAFASDELGTAEAPLTRAAAGVVLSNSDGVIRNSLCVGFDCPNSPTFSDTTILMVENNTRIKFDDTSTLNSFPRNDWEIEANSNLNGGQSYIGFNDCGQSSQGGCATDLVFAVEAGVRQHALYVESDGDVGLGTQNPVVRLHAVDGDTPALRLEQDGSSGFQAQVWDVAGNETNFFVRDATNGSTLPFRIQPGAASNSIFIESTNDVGIGTSSPTASLHVRRTSGSAKLRVEDTTGDSILDAMELLNAGEVRFAMEDTSAASRRWEFRTTGANFQFTRDDAPAADMLIDTNGNVTIRGNLVTGGGGLCDPGPCDGVFAPDYEVESIEEHAAYMWANRHLWGVGPTPEGAPINISKKTTGILHELEKAHIYIEQLHRRNAAMESEYRALQSEQQATRDAQQALRDELDRLRAEVTRLVGQSP